MNGYQRVLSAINSQSSDAVPVMLHNFMLAARESDVTMSAYRTDPRTIADVHIRAAERYDLDGVIIDIDTVTLAGAVGVPVDLPENEPARSHEGNLPSLSAVQDLPPVDISKYDRVQTWLEAIRLLRNHFGDELMIRGNCDQCPFSLASMMRTPAEWMMDLVDEENHPLVFQLLEYCTEATSQFLRLMGTAGAHMLSNGDSPAGPDMISPTMYRQFALPYEQRIAAVAVEAGLPYILHVCGDTSPILEDLVTVGAQGLDLDYKTDLHRTHEVLKDRATLCGNLDPVSVIAQGTVEFVEQKSREIVDLFADSPRFILNAGCAIPPDAPAENIEAMVRVAHGG